MKKKWIAMLLCACMMFGAADVSYAAGAGTAVESAGETGAGTGAESAATGTVTGSEAEATGTTATTHPISGDAADYAGESATDAAEPESEQEQPLCADEITEVHPALVQNLKDLDVALGLAPSVPKRRAALKNYNNTQYSTHGVGGICPSVGDVHTLVVMVEFSDVKFTPGVTEKYVRQMFFGAEDVNSEYYPKESVRA